jgi:hypothetical protein
VEASVLVTTELEAAIDKLEEGLDPDTFWRVIGLIAQLGEQEQPTETPPLAGSAR